jgi:hypothetical protein
VIIYMETDNGYIVRFHIFGPGEHSFPFYPLANGPITVPHRNGLRYLAGCISLHSNLYMNRYSAVSALQVKSISYCEETSM